MHNKRRRRTSAPQHEPEDIALLCEVFVGAGASVLVGVGASTVRDGVLSGVVCNGTLFVGEGEVGTAIGLEVATVM